MYLRTKMEIVNANGVIKKDEVCEVLEVGVDERNCFIYAKVESNDGVIACAKLFKYFEPTSVKGSISVDLITCDSGDYEVLKFNNKLDKKKEVSYEGHSISNHQWMDLIKNLGYDVREKCISDEDMEMENY